MYQGLLHTHNLLRWVILILLLYNVFRNIAVANRPFSKTDKGAALPLLIAAHITLLIGVYQWIVGPLGLNLIQTLGGSVMKDSVSRFWAVEHPVMMLLGIIFITIAYRQGKSNRPAKVQRKNSLIYYFLALVVIMLAVPWPFREVVGRPLIPGMY